jgi:ketosteroid isomerase-like protein
MRVLAVVLLSAVLVSTAHADWRATNTAVSEAAKNPRIAAVLALTKDMDSAIIAHDTEKFGRYFADDAVVNSPFNNVARKSDALERMRTGLIDYTSLERSIEYAAVRGEHDVVLMGEERLTPVGKSRFAGKTITRRTTEIWTDVTGTWKLAIRQATIYQSE